MNQGQFSGPESFGDVLSQYLHRKHGLSQRALADGIDVDPAVISHMCRGKRLRGSQARERVVNSIAWLHKQGVLTLVAEANRLLEAAGMARLRADDATEEQLLQVLNAEDVHQPSSVEPASATESQSRTSTSRPSIRQRIRRLRWPILILLTLIVGSFAFVLWPRPQPLQCPATALDAAIAGRQNKSDYYQRSLIYHKLHAYQCAIADVNLVLAEKPDDEWALYSRGVAYYYENDFPRAIDDLSKAIQFMPWYEWAFYYRGLAYDKLADREQAIHDYERVLDLGTDTKLRTRTTELLTRLQADK